MRFEGFPYETIAPEDLDETTEPCSLTDELRLYLQTEVTRRRCEARRIAHLRKMNRRTLSRRLRAEGTTFKQLADEVRLQAAKELLTEPCISLAQISAILNFSQPSAFTHAFRRWSGMTPSAWRRSNT